MSWYFCSAARQRGGSNQRTQPRPGRCTGKPHAVVGVGMRCRIAPREAPGAQLDRPARGARLAEAGGARAGGSARAGGAHEAQLHAPNDCVPA